MAFDPENDLEMAFLRASQDPIHAAEFYRQFIDGVVYFIEQEVASDTGDAVGIAALTIDGTQMLPIFSSVTRLQECIDEEVSYAGVNGLEFLRMTAGATLVLNPSSDISKEISPEEAAAIIDGTIFVAVDPQTMSAGTEYVIGEPKEYPTQLVSMLTRFFAMKREVSRAWIAQIMVLDTDPAPHALVGIETDGDMQALASEAHNLVQHVEIPNPPLDFMQVDGRPGITDYFLDKEPFYSRD